MTACSRIRPLLYVVAEGEAAPREAMVVARHLPECTACRIVLARAHRLAAMLEGGLEDVLQGGDEFVRTIMDKLPHEPPRRRRVRMLKHGLRLAGLSGLLLLGGRLGGIASGAAGLASGLPLRLPAWSADAAESGARGLAGSGGWLLGAAELLATGIPSLGGALSSPSGRFVTLGLGVAIGLCGVAGLVAVASARLIREA